MGPAWPPANTSLPALADPRCLGDCGAGVEPSGRLGTSTPSENVQPASQSISPASRFFFRQGAAGRAGALWLSRCAVAGPSARALPFGYSSANPDRLVSSDQRGPRASGDAIAALLARFIGPLLGGVLGAGVLAPRLPRLGSVGCFATLGAPTLLRSGSFGELAGTDRRVGQLDLLASPRE